MIDNDGRDEQQVTSVRSRFVLARLTERLSDENTRGELVLSPPSCSWRQAPRCSAPRRVEALKDRLDSNGGARGTDFHENADESAEHVIMCVVEVTRNLIKDERRRDRESDRRDRPRGLQVVPSHLE